MSDFDSDLRKLVEKNKIEELRYRYWYAILDKDVERLVDCFTDDVRLEYGFGIVLNGKDEVRNFFNSLLGNPEMLRQVPRGANGVVEFMDEASAKGRWMVEAVTVNKGKQEASLASVQYFESYIKVAGEWKLAHMKNDYLYFESINISSAE